MLGFRALGQLALGQEATNNNKSLSAGAGSYAISGTNASLLHKWVLSAAAGSYAVTGTNATLIRKLPLVAGAGSYAITGTNASLLHQWKIAAVAGSYAVTGTNASLLHKWKLTADVGSYAITGTAASLLHKWKLTADAGSYAITGTAATLTRKLPLVAGAGSYVITGTDATLTKTTSAAAYVLFAEDGILRDENGNILYDENGDPLLDNINNGYYKITGTSVSLVIFRRLSADAGSYAITGTDATLTIGTATPPATDAGLTGGWGAGGRQHRAGQQPRIRKLSELDKLKEELLFTPEEVIASVQLAEPDRDRILSGVLEQFAKVADEALRKRLQHQAYLEQHAAAVKRLAEEIDDEDFILLL